MFEITLVDVLVWESKLSNMLICYVENISVNE